MQQQPVHRSNTCTPIACTQHPSSYENKAPAEPHIVCYSGNCCTSRTASTTSLRHKKQTIECKTLQGLVCLLTY